MWQNQIVKELQSTGPPSGRCPDSNPRRRITSAESSPLDDQCLSGADSRSLNTARTVVQTDDSTIRQSAVVGPEGLEPSPAWVRTRDAAANTSIPCCLFSVGSDGVEPSSDPYKESALTIELRASIQSVGPEGLEPPPCRLKVCCAAVTPRPHGKSGVSVSTAVESSFLSFRFFE